MLVYCQKYKLLFLCWVLSLSGISCQSLGPSKNGSAKLLGESMGAEHVEKMRFFLPEGHKDESIYRSRTQIQTFEQGQIVQKRIQEVDFQVGYEVIKSTPEKGEFTFKEVTLNKEGLTDLRNFGVPEYGEELIRTFNDLGFVAHVKGQSKDSFYYVPSLVFPEGPVRAGESWELNHKWKQDGEPYYLKITFTLRDYKRCFSTERCAIIDLTGRVAPDQKKSKGENLHWGQIVYLLEKNLVLFGEFYSNETMPDSKSKDVSHQVQSCLKTTLKSPEKYQWLEGVNYQNLSCEFKQDPSH